jgi:hypothetical protein
VSTVHFSDAFSVARPPQDVFAFMVDPANLAKWQTIKTSVTPVTDGPPRLGYRLREGNRVGPRRWEQLVEFTEFEPGAAFAVRVVEGPPSRGRWVLRPEGAGTRVSCEVELEAPRGLGFAIKPLTRRQFRKYHRNLRAELERAP